MRRAEEHDAIGVRLKIDLAFRDNRGFSPLENGARMGKEEAAVALIEAESTEGKTMQFFGRAMKAAIQGDESAVVATLRHGAGPNTPLSTGLTPLNMAASKGAVKVAGILLNSGADPVSSVSGLAFGLDDIKIFGHGDQLPCRSGSNHSRVSSARTTRRSA